MKFITSIHKYIPGFRQLSAQSMAVAATYYIAAFVILFHIWYIGLAMLALPFLIFSLIDLGAGKSRRLPLAVACAAGVLVLLSSAVALSPGTVPAGAENVLLTSAPGTATPRPSAAQKLSASPIPSAAITNTETPRLSSPIPSTTRPAASATPSVGADEAQYAFVAAKGSEVFHLPGCASAKRIKPGNLIGYQTRDEAIAAGLRPCKRCKP